MPLADPWLSHRMAHYAAVRRAENQLHPAVQQAAAALLAETERAITGNLTAATFARRDGEPAGMPGPSAWQRLVNRFIAPVARTLWRGSYQTTTGHAPEQTPAPAEEEYSSGLAERTDGFRRNVADTLRRALTLGRQRRETPAQLKARVADLMALENWDGQVMTMTRTETISALNSGALHGALTEQERTGQPWEKRWQSTHDQRVRPEHREADAQVRPLHDPFEVGGHKLQFPGDPHGPPEAVINCRCGARYGPAGDPSLTAAARFHGTPGRPSYRKYHPSGRNAKSAGLTRHANGGMLGSNRFTEEEHFQALKRYTRHGYRSMNKLLRSGPEGMSEADLEIVRPRVAALTDLIAVQEPTTAETTLYRGVEDMRLDMIVGDEFHDKGFVSTSKRENISENFVGDDGTMVRIIVPRGSQVLNIESVGEDDDEGEVILPPGTKYRVKRVIREGGDSTAPYYEVEVING